MLFLTKEATNKNKKLKMDMLISTTDDKKKSEAIWEKNGFFSDQKGEFTISKNNFPENTLVDCNQGTMSGDCQIWRKRYLPWLRCLRTNYSGEKLSS